MPKISVVIPLYNKGPYIERALRSVQSQTIQEFEIVVVDDGSTDRGADVVEGFEDPRIRLIQQTNMGAVLARNRGIREAEADFIAFLDADDEWKPRFLETLIRLFDRYPEAGIFCTSFITARPDGKTGGPRQGIVPPPPWEGLIPSYFLSAALGGPSPSASSAGVTKEVLAEFDGFSSGSWYGEDVDLWGRIALKYPIAFSWYTGAVYHEDALNRACSQKKPLREHPFLKTVQEEIRRGSVPEELLPDLMEYVAALKIQVAARNICMDEPAMAKPFLDDCETKLLHRQKLFWQICAQFPPSVFMILRRMSRIMGWSVVS